MTMPHPSPDPSAPPSRIGWHLLALVLVAVAVWIQFLRAPGFGDDLTYWSRAFDVHERGLETWGKKSFHDLRWPVWGVCWVLQSIFGFGLASYYGPPLIFLTAGAAIALVFVHRATRSIPLAWAAALAFLFHPLLDTVCYRPMPDISEGVWSGLVLLAWWAMVTASNRWAATGFAVLTGLGVFIIQANRITGVFIVPVLIVATLMLFPRKFGWLVLAGVCSAFFYGLECLFYKDLFGDWLHNLHANTGAKGKKGTEAVALWTMPLRFLDTLWGGIGPVYCIFGAIGLWAGWKKFGAVGRLMVLWFVVLYLSYSCAPQSLFPYRPLVRDADRFLSGLAIPMSALAVFGLATVFDPKLLGRWSVGSWWGRHPVVSGVLGFVLLSAITTRDRFALDYVPEMRRYMASLPPGTKVFTHHSMRPIAFLVHADAAQKIDWRTRNSILYYDSDHEAEAAGCSELWYARKLLWLNIRKEIEAEQTAEQPRLASYFDHPEQEWTMTRLLAKADTPDLIFYRRRAAGAPAPIIVPSTAPEWQGLIPALPYEWQQGQTERRVKTTWTVPKEWQGHLVRLEMEGASDEVEGVTFRLRFTSSEDPKFEIREFTLKPYFYTRRGKDFFALQLPPGADRCEIQAQFLRSTKSVKITSFRAVIEPDVAVE